MERSLNVQLIDMTILQKGWSKERAALECGIDHQTLKRIYEDKNVRNEVILRVSKGLNIPLEQLVVWRSRETTVQQPMYPESRVRKGTRGSQRNR
jgi:DNA-binding Xre family transcriptional regulator